MQTVVTPVNSTSTSMDVDSVVLKMLTELATTPQKQDDHQDREYQAFLVELAKRKNVIVCLPTGSGKTFIALLLTKHYLKEAIETNRKIVFLANTVPLVHQQAEYFHRHLSNQFLNEDSHHVECLTGERQVDYWEPKKWKVVLDNCNVLVMTTQIFVDALGHGYIHFSDVIFLILDECHHTDKDAPMNKVMEMYRDILTENDMKLDLQKLPRVLGLTATIINGKGKRIEVAQEVRDAEERLCARAVTYHKYEEVLKYSTCAKVEYVLYSSAEPTAWSQELAKPLRNFLTVIMNSNKELFSEKLPDIYHPSFKNNDQRFNSKESDLKPLKSLVKEVLDVFKDLGPYCAKIAAIHKRAYLQTRNFDDVENVYTGYMMKALDTALAVFICQIERLMGKLYEEEQIRYFVTDKISKLLKILEDYNPEKDTSKNGRDDTLSGLIFVQQRITAQALTWYLEDAARTSAFKFMKPGFVVGSATFGLDPVEARITANEQAAVIRKFRSRDYNLLVATRVLEEGLDVPACNLVVRFDKVHTYPSYVQSMGRARNKNSKFFGFIDSADEISQKDQYVYFEKYNMQLSEYLRQNAMHADEDFEDDIRTTVVEKIIPNFEPNPGRSPRITALESISIAQRYCQTLPCDKLVTLSPVSWWEKVEPSEGKTGYRAYVQFPSNAVIREIVPGTVQETKMLAKRSAFLEACILLYRKNVLDDKLFPLPRRLNPVLNAFMENIFIEKDPQGRKVGSSKRTQHYYKKIPDCFKLGKISAGCCCKVYEIRVEQLKLTDDRVATSLYRFSERNYVYCIITPVNLSMIPQFILNVNPTIGYLVVTVKEMQLEDRPPGVKLTQQEIERLQSVQRYIFGDLLRMKRPFMKVSDESSFLIAPLKRVPGGDHRIHWDLVAKLLELSEDFFSLPSEESQKRFDFKSEDYEDSVVVPWYRGKERFFYTVVEICKDETPLSPFLCNKNYSSYESYFKEKYSSCVKYVHPRQLLLKAKLISSNLNFFKTNVSYKKSQEERKDQRDSIVDLIPQLNNRHPLPASLYIQSKLLPSIIQRIHRFLCAHEIQRFVAKDTPWSGVTEVAKDYMEEWRNLIVKTDPTDIDCPPPKKGKLSISTGCGENGSKGTSVQVHQPLRLGPNLETQIAEQSVVEERSESSKTVLNESDEPVLDFIHPRDLSITQVDRIKDRTKGLRETKVRKSHGFKINENDTRFDWKHGKETPIELVDFDTLDRFLKEKLDEDFTFAREKQPTLYTLMQSITMEASLDSVTLERLETIGDSFLKYCVSRHVFSFFPELDEGKMTQWRSTLVSNAYLYTLGKQLKLGEYLAGGIFRPECAWLPPSFQIPQLLSKVAADNDLNDDVFATVNVAELENMSYEELSEFATKNKCEAPNLMPGNVGYTHARVPDKSVADSVEALIGAYFISGGQGGALHFMERVGFRGPTSVENERVPFGKWPYPAPKYNPGSDSVSNHHSLFHELEKVICYKFKEPWLLVEAFSHPCYMKNRVTECYQRLEFLGDAVLDFLITNHIYKGRVMDPGDLTDLRSALVNNVTFGSLSVRYGFETYLLNTDRKLQEAIDVFVECQKAVKHQVTGHFKLLDDSDCHLVSDIDCPKVLGDIFESLAGAVFIDCGMSLDTVWKVFYRLMKNEIDMFSLNVPKSPVRTLYENNPGRTIFKDVTDEAFKTGAEKDPGMCYVALTVPINDQRGKLRPVIGRGKSKQSAKLAAAKYANKLEEFHKAARK